MPESFDEAVRQGVRRGLRNLLSNLGAHLGKGLAWLAVALTFLFIALWVMDWMWDGFTSPFRSAWSWTTDKFDSVTGWLPGGDAAADQGTEMVTEEVVKEAPAEPGVICRNTGGWNLFCK